MNTIRIPHGLRELFGEESTPAELSVVSGFAVVSTVAAMWTTGNEWLGLGTFAAILIALLMVDIYGGVIANLSVGTNRYYGHSKKRRLIFIAVHVQPMLFALIEGDHMGPAVIVWAFTMVSALLVDGLRGRSIQRMIGLMLGIVGVLIVYSGASGAPMYMRATLMMYVVKVIYSFSVDHYAASDTSAP